MPHMKQRTNEEWLQDLSDKSEAREEALNDLHAIILKSLPYALSKWLSPSNPQFSSFTEEVAQDTLLRVLDKMNTFEGRSKFTTWVHKIAIRIALTDLRRQRWKDVSLNELTENDDGFFSPGIMADPSFGPEVKTEQQDMLERVRKIIDTELTEKQRRAMIAIMINGMPIEEVARQMNIKRNALYKLIHDARLRLKRRLVLEDLTTEEILSVFNQE